MSAQQRAEGARNECTAGVACEPNNRLDERERFEAFVVLPNRRVAADFLEAKEQLLFKCVRVKESMMLGGPGRVKV